jgi:hypothetical protein
MTHLHKIAECLHVVAREVLLAEASSICRG